LEAKDSWQGQSISIRENAGLACCPEQQLIINCFRLQEQQTKKKKLYNHDSDKDYSMAAVVPICC
jgi:hypothetical protein